MKKTLLSILGAVALTVPASATIIDDFTSGGPSTGTLVSTGAPAGPTSYPGTNVIAPGSRQVTVTCFNAGVACGVGRQAEFRVDTVNGLGNLNTDNQVDSQVLLEYLGLSLNASTDTEVDVKINVDAAGIGTVLSLILSDGTNTKSIDRTVLASSAQILVWDLASFAPVNLSSITSLKLLINTIPAASDGSDVDIDIITSTTPEPSTFVMMGSALLGLAFLRRKSA